MRARIFIDIFLIISPSDIPSAHCLKNVLDTLFLLHVGLIHLKTKYSSHKYLKILYGAWKRVRQTGDMINTSYMENISSSYF